MSTDLVNVSPSSLRRAFAEFPTGVVAICAELEGQPVAMVASTFVGVSLAPALVTACIQNSSATWLQLRRARHLGISVLGQTHDAVARALAGKSGDKFEGVKTTRRDNGAVFVNSSCAWLDVTVVQEIPAGDHSIVMMQVIDLDILDELPIVFHRSRFNRLGESD